MGRPTGRRSSAGSGDAEEMTVSTRQLRLQLAALPGSAWIFRYFVVRGSTVRDVATTRRAAVRRFQADRKADAWFRRARHVRPAMVRTGVPPGRDAAGRYRARSRPRRIP